MSNCAWMRTIPSEGRIASVPLSIESLMPPYLASHLHLAALTIFIAATANADETAPISTHDGIIKGVVENGVQVFKGIPYASPPVKELRWMPPQPVEPWDGSRQCNEFGAACPQIPNSLYKTGQTQLKMSEDCLYLNVWTPSLDKGKRLPVMVWIHGGGNVSGSGHQPTYDGANLAQNGVVLVTINYRLGRFGFFAHPLLSEESASGTSGNYGILDQIQALKWVQQNIQQFGGDPNNVTIFGESAGGVDCTVLMLSPLAKGLFHRVIAQSGTTLMSRRFLDRKSGEASSGHEAGELLVEDWLGDSSHSLSRLRSLTSAQLLRSQSGGGIPNPRKNPRALGVLIDGYVLPEEPHVLLAKGDFNQVPLMIGMNTDESTLFTQKIRFFFPAGYRRMLGDHFPGSVEDVFSQYPGNSGKEATQSFKQLMSDSMFLQPGREFADYVSGHGAPVYFYVFGRTPPFAARAGLGAFHALEIGYVFENLDAQNPRLFGATDRALSSKMSAYWRSFATSGTPNETDLPTWPRYDAKQAKYLHFDETVSVKSEYRQPEYQLLKRLKASTRRN
ncbi:MAG: carboxylesterase family protein [Planctomycetota bacterium]